jgi:hypothetical protein
LYHAPHGGDFQRSDDDSSYSCDNYYDYINVNVNVNNNNSRRSRRFPPKLRRLLLLGY